MSMLQHESSSARDKVMKTMMMRRRRIKDLAAQEILRERWDAIESGKLKGRRLFLPVKGVSEVRSLSSCYSEGESSGIKGQNCCSRDCPSSSSSSSSSHCLFDAHVDKGQEVKKTKDDVAALEERKFVIGWFGNGVRYAVFLCRFALIASLIIAICMSSLTSSDEIDYELAALVPT